MLFKNKKQLYKAIENMKYIIAETSLYLMTLFNALLKCPGSSFFLNIR